jgi:hypothetical protein
MEKKESTGRHLNRHYPPYAKPSSNSSLAYHRNDDALQKMDLQRKVRVDATLRRRQ